MGVTVLSLSEVMKIMFQRGIFDSGLETGCHEGVKLCLKLFEGDEREDMISVYLKVGE